MVERQRPPAAVTRLRGLELSELSLSPAFDSSEDTYTATVPSALSQTTVKPLPLDVDATVVVKLGGVAEADGTVDLAVGSNIITVEVTAEDGVTTRTYTVTVTRAASTDATLSSLSLSGVTLAPAFSPSTTSYTVDAASSVSSTTVTAATTHSGATAVVKLGGVVDADSTVDLAVGSNTITVEVTAEDGTTTQTYTVTVTRAVSTDATLSSLSLSGVTLAPAFSPSTISYTANAANRVSSTTVTPATTHPGATVAIALDGVVDSDGTVNLAVGTNSITVVVTAEDGTTTQTYTVTVTRAAAPPPPPEVSGGGGSGGGVSSGPPGPVDPTLVEGGETSREVLENSEPGAPVGAPFAARDPDSEMLTFFLTGIGRDKELFTIDPETGQLYTGAVLDYETKRVYRVVVGVRAEDGGDDYIRVIIHVVDQEPEPTPTPTPVPTATPTVVPTATPTPVPTATPTPSPTPTPTPTATSTPAPTPTTVPTATATPTPTPTVTPTATPTPGPVPVVEQPDDEGGLPWWLWLLLLLLLAALVAGFVAYMGRRR